MLYMLLEVINLLQDDVNMYEYFTCCYFGRSSSLMNVSKLVEIFNDCWWTGVRGTSTLHVFTLENRQAY
jgi:hypothetical protein